MSGRIPDHFIRELLARVDIIEIVGARVPLKRAGKDYTARCPFHDEKSPSFTVSPVKQFYHCFGCGVHGSAIGFLMQYDRMSFPEAVKDLADRVGLPLPREMDRQTGADAAQDSLEPLYTLLQLADQYYRRQLREHPQAEVAAQYLRSRGLTGEIAREFGIGFASDSWDALTHALGTDDAVREALIGAGLALKREDGRINDRFRARILFPIHDHRGRIVGFGGRAMGDAKPKYLNSPETALFHKGRELYGLHRARDAIAREHRVMVVEGYLDVIALAQFGVDFAVATLGTATTPDHLSRLFRHAPEIIFCFDGDAAGRKAAWRALEVALPELRAGRQASFLFLPEGEDPDTLIRKEGREAFVARLSQAQSLPDFLFTELGGQVDLSRLDGRARLVELARPRLKGVKPGPLRMLLMQKLGEMAGLPTERITRMIEQDEALDRSRAGLIAAGPTVADPATMRSSVAERPPVPKWAPAGRTPLLRQALALIIQHPELALDIREPELLLPQDRKGAGLLTDLIRTAQANPGITTAQLVEIMRDNEYHAHLSRLAVWERLTPEAGLQAELTAIFARFQTDRRKARLAELVAVERAGGLSEEGRRELRDLLAASGRPTGAGPGT